MAKKSPDNVVPMNSGIDPELAAVLAERDDAYVQTLASKHKTIPIGVVTRITLDQGVQFAAPRFSVVRPLKAEEFETYMSRREEANTRLTAEPDVSQYAPPKGATAGRGQPVRRGVR